MTETASHDLWMAKTNNSWEQGKNTNSDDEYYSLIITPGKNFIRNNSMSKTRRWRRWNISTTTSVKDLNSNMN